MKVTDVTSVTGAELCLIKAIEEFIAHASEDDVIILISGDPLHTSASIRRSNALFLAHCPEV